MNFTANNQPQCIGYGSDKLYDLVQMLDCVANRSNVQLKRVFGSRNGPDGTPIFQMQTPNGFCVSVPREAEQQVELVSDNVRVIFGTSGIQPYNFTYIVSLRVWQPAFSNWSPNLADSNRKNTHSHFSSTP